MKKLHMGPIVAANKAAGSHFFDRATLRFFNDVPGNWDPWEHEGRTFIRNARHKRGPGAFSHCTLRGQWREVHTDGNISMPIRDAHGLTPKAFATWLNASGAGRFD